MASTWCLVPILLSYIMYLFAFSLWLRIRNDYREWSGNMWKSQQGTAISYFNLDVSWAFYSGQLSFYMLGVIFNSTWFSQWTWKWWERETFYDNQKVDRSMQQQCSILRKSTEMFKKWLTLLGVKGNCRVEVVGGWHMIKYLINLTTHKPLNLECVLWNDSPPKWSRGNVFKQLFLMITFNCWLDQAKHVAQTLLIC